MQVRLRQRLNLSKYVFEIINKEFILLHIAYANHSKSECTDIITNLLVQGQANTKCFSNMEASCTNNTT